MLNQQNKLQKFRAINLTLVQIIESGEIKRKSKQFENYELRDYTKMAFYVAITLIEPNKKKYF